MAQSIEEDGDVYEMQQHIIINNHGGLLLSCFFNK